MKERAEFIKINDAITLINDRDESTYYLVCGENKALMIDTGNGYDNVMDIARTLTKLPVEVVNTHGHCDHVYGNQFCTNAWMHPNDFQLCKEHFQMLQESKKNQEISSCPLMPLEKGKIFDLGGLELEVIELMGHTHGSIGLLDRKHHILFSGDAINPCIWLQLEESLPLVEFHRNISEMMQNYGDDFDYHLSGHTLQLIPKQAILDLLTGCGEIINGDANHDEDYTWFGGVHKAHIYGDGNGKQICYNQNNIFTL